MNERRYVLWTLLSVIVLGLSVSGCVWAYRPGEVHSSSRSIELGEAETVDAVVRMGAGELRIGAGSDALMDGEFLYNLEDWEPTVDYVVSGNRGELRIEQPGLRSVGVGSFRYEWDLAFNSTVPLDLRVRLGAGESDVNVSELLLDSLEVEMGAGELRLDLTGEREQDLLVHIRGGVGQATILLPSEVGVLVDISGGIGSVDTSGLERQGDIYVNEAYQEAESTMTLDIEAGVGQIVLRVVE